MARRHRAHSAEPGRGDLLLRYQRLGGSRPVVCSLTHYAPGDQYPVHRHDFAEMSWVLWGHVVFTTRQGEFTIDPHAIISHHPDSAHGLRAESDGALLVNVAMPAAAIVGQPWGTAEQPLIETLAVQDFADFDAWVATPEPQRHLADLFQLLAHLRQPSPMPPWWDAAMRDTSLPHRLAAGAPRLVQACGRSREHVSRSCRTYLAHSLADIVRRRRFAQAVRSIRLGVGVREACAAVGIINRTVFHRAVVAAYGCTPGALPRFAVPDRRRKMVDEPPV